MPVGRVSLCLVFFNFITMLLFGYFSAPDGDQLAKFPGDMLISFTCANSDGFWVDSSRAISVALGVPICIVGTLFYLKFGKYTREEMQSSRNGSSVITGGLLASVALILLAFSYFPCNSFYQGFSLRNGIFPHQMGYALRGVLSGSQLVFDMLYSLVFCGISYCMALVIKIKTSKPC